MDRNHQVDLLKMAHERFFLDEKAAEHTGFPQGTIDKLNHINALGIYRDWETDRKSTRLNSSHSAKSRMPSSA